MGSGKQIKNAIKKYGKENFNKEILGIFNSDEEAALLESKLVTKEVIKSGQSYNMHEGGRGGFAHLNDGSRQHRERSSRGSKMVKKRYDISLQKKSRFNSESSQRANGYKRDDMIKNPEKYKQAYIKISQKQKEHNSMKDRIWIFRGIEKQVIHKTQYESFKKLGWESASDIKNKKESKMKNRWCNNGQINRLISAEEVNIMLLNGFVLGRISSKVVDRC